MQCISQGFLDCGLHNDEYTKNQLIENFGLRDNHLKGTSHRKEECDLLQVVYVQQLTT